MKTVFIVILIILGIVTLLIFAPSIIMQNNNSGLAEISITAFDFNDVTISNDQRIKYIKVTVIKKVNSFVWGKIVIKYKAKTIATLQASLFNKDTELIYIVPVFSRNRIFELSKLESTWDEINSK